MRGKIQFASSFSGESTRTRQPGAAAVGRRLDGVWQGTGLLLGLRIGPLRTISVSKHVRPRLRPSPMKTPLSKLHATFFSALLLFGPPGGAAAEDAMAALDAHLAAHRDGRAPFSFDASDYEGDLSHLPIGVFDSGIGGLTVLEAILSLDAFDNDDLSPGPDGRPDFENERFLYLGDQANMPYGNYPKSGRADYLRELILKDAVFLLGRRYHGRGDGEGAGEEGGPRFDKPPVKAIVIACNTATAYGYEDLKAAMQRWGIPVIVVGVVEAGARGLLAAEVEDGAIGVMATVGTCESGVYPKTIQSTLGRAGRGPAAVVQHGSADLAAVIEGDASRGRTVAEQVGLDVRELVEEHRRSADGEAAPLSRIVLGCTHFSLVLDKIEAAFAELREDPAYAPWIAERRTYIDPAEWAARQLFRELASARLRHRPGEPRATDRDLFFLSVPDPKRSNARRNSDGSLHEEYKYGRLPGNLGVEDTVVVPLTRDLLPEAGRRLVEGELPEVWRRIPPSAAESAGNEGEGPGKAAVAAPKLR